MVQLSPLKENAEILEHRLGLSGLCRHLLEHLDGLWGAQESPGRSGCYLGGSLHVTLLQQLSKLLLIEIVSTREVEAGSYRDGKLTVSELADDVGHKRTLIETHEEHL